MNLLSLDTETALTTDQCKAPPLACVSWARHDGTSGLFHHSDPRLKGWIVEQLTHATIVGVNIAFDMAVILERWPDLAALIFRAYREGRILDVRLAQKLADIANGEHESPRYMFHGKPYTLEALTWRHLGRELDKSSWRMGYDALRSVALELWPEGAKKYPVDDALAGLGCYLKIVEKYGVFATGDLARQSRHGFALHLVSCWGIKTDQELVQRVKAETEARQDALAEIILTNGLLRQEKKGLVKTPAAAKTRMIAMTPPELRRLTKTGLDRKKKGLDAPWDKYVSTDAEACYVSGDSVLVAYAGYASLGTRLSSQFPHLEAGEIHAQYEPLRETGRSASGGDDSDGSSTKYNIQNPPTGDPDGVLLGERECFVPRPGYVFGDNDYGGLELCTGAQMNIDLHGRSEMAKVLNRAAPYNDCHTAFACDILGGKEFDWVLANKKTALVVVARDSSKRCNFGLGGGMGAPRFVQTCNKADAKLFIATGRRPESTITLARAVELKAKWLQRWTEFLLHFSWAKSLTGSYERPRKAKIKQLRVDRWRGGLSYNDVCNGPFQALGSDVAKDALFDVVEAMYDPSQASVLYGSRVVAFVHDQIISEFPETRAHECALEQTRFMNEAAIRFLPDCPARTAPTLSWRWSKGAKEIYGPDGRLVVWEHPALQERRAA